METPIQRSNAEFQPHSLEGLIDPTSTINELEKPHNENLKQIIDIWSKELNLSTFDTISDPAFIDTIVENKIGFEKDEWVNSVAKLAALNLSLVSETTDNHSAIAENKRKCVKALIDFVGQAEELTNFQVGTTADSANNVFRAINNARNSLDVLAVQEQLIRSLSTPGSTREATTQEEIDRVLSKPGITIPYQEWLKITSTLPYPTDPPYELSTNPSARESTSGIKENSETAIIDRERVEYIKNVVDFFKAHPNVISCEFFQTDFDIKNSKLTPFIVIEATVAVRDMIATVVVVERPERVQTRNSTTGEVISDTTHDATYMFGCLGRGLWKAVFHEDQDKHSARTRSKPNLGKPGQGTAPPDTFYDYLDINDGRVYMVPVRAAHRLQHSENQLERTIEKFRLILDEVRGDFTRHVQRNPNAKIGK